MPGWSGAWSPDADQASDVGWQHHHQGLHWHAATGLYANRMRWYDSALMRFISPDPLGYPDGANRYSAYQMNPAAYTDALGLTSVGHHPVPKQVLQERAHLMDDDARQHFIRTYTGPTSPHHNFREMGGVKHINYNQLVLEEMDKFIKEKDITPQRKMTCDQAKQFSDRIWKSGGDIGKFNRAVDKVVVGPGTIGRGRDISAKHLSRGVKRMPGRGAAMSIAAVAGVLLTANDSLAGRDDAKFVRRNIDLYLCGEIPSTTLVPTLQEYYRLPELAARDLENSIPNYMPKPDQVDSPLYTPKE